MLVFGQCAVASLHSLQRVEERRRKKRENGGKCLSDRSMYKVYFLLLLLRWFYLIRTQAFSVFSEVSRGGGTAARQNNTQTWESLKQRLYEQKRRPADDLVLVPRFFNRFPPPPSIYRAGRVHLLLSHHHSLFFSNLQYLELFSASRREDFGFEVTRPRFQCSHFLRLSLKSTCGFFLSCSCEVSTR